MKGRKKRGIEQGGFIESLLFALTKDRTVVLRPLLFFFVQPSSKPFVPRTTTISAIATLTST